MKCVGAVIAYRAYKIIGKLVTLVNVAAYRTDVSVLFIAFRLGLYVPMIIGIRHTLGVGYTFRFCNLTNKQPVSAEVGVADYLK